MASEHAGHGDMESVNSLQTILYVLYAALLAVLLWQFKRLEERRRRLARSLDLAARIAEWPRGSLQDLDTLIGHLLDQAAGILEAPRVLLVWEETDEPWLHIAHRTANGTEVTREPPEEEETEEVLSRRFGVERSAAWPLRGAIVQGRFFALDRQDFERDHLVLGEIAAQRIAAELDQFYLTRRLRVSVVTEERMRLACDLHDGMLQSLTGTALQLKALAGQLDDDPPAAREELREIQRLIASDQRDLRFFIEELKPAPGPLAGTPGLAEHLDELAGRIKRLWGLKVEISLDGLDGHLSEAFSRQLYRLLREALFNVARHAGASTARAEVARQGQSLHITVTDDGHGFPFQGRYDHEELTRRKLGPVSLKERISTLGGSLAIDTAPGRTCLEVLLPTGGAR
ncbi:MAG TPA: sensor histidine kinase [Thermoanaerobaculia bacterium]